MNITKDTRIYVAGCGGMLGEAVYNHFSPIAELMVTDIDTNERWLDYADVRDYSSISHSIEEFQPHIIINLAALTDLEECEENKENAWLTNGLGAENIVLIASKLNATLIHISTAGIFDGKKEYYSDFEIPNPMGTYAKSKHYAEIIVSRELKKYYVFRAGWMMGGGPRKDKKFINKLYKQICQGNNELNVVDDKLGTPTYTVDFVRGIQTLVKSDLYGIYNQVCGGSGSRYDVAVEFVKLMGLKDKIQINKVSSEFFKEEYFAPRPKSEKLLNSKLDARRLNVMRDWKVCLREYVKYFKDDYYGEFRGNVV